MKGALTRKVARTWRFLRYGPAQIKVLAGQIAALEAANRQQFADLEAANRQQFADLVQESTWARNRVGGLSAAIDRLGHGATGEPGGQAGMPAGATAAEEGFYPALEEAFRGSAELVRDRLQVYRAWIDSLPEGPVGDIGCGRGEWLQLLKEWHRVPRGVDLNAMNVEHVRALGLEADQGDALQWLSEQPEDSFAALTAFHVVEHLPFGVLLRLAQEAARVLRPGGRLILKRPNPENLAVVTNTFWLDPTHQRPIPPELLQLVVRYSGLIVEAAPRLHPPSEGALLATDPVLRAMLMQGRDYAVIARKPTVPAA